MSEKAKTGFWASLFDWIKPNSVESQGGAWIEQSQGMYNQNPLSVRVGQQKHFD